jgi:hypothetical protein
MLRTWFCPALLGLAAPLSPQSNVDAALDLHLADIDQLTAMGRAGAYPNGVNGCALETTACNLGTKAIPWHAAMASDHPFIAFLMARESNGRFEQISDQSFVKHGFFALSSELCRSCAPTDGTTLGVGCSDTYATSNNGDPFWLGPPSEIDPWLGHWNPQCSHFDRGEPPVAAPADCNGLRSLSAAQANALGPLNHRIHVSDADFNVPNAAFWYQAQYVIGSEDEAKRGDNLASRAFTPVWTGSRWDLVDSGALLHGSILQRWSGATVQSTTNGVSDGRVYVATKVSGPSEGFYRYEIAVHNRDNARGVGAVRIPVCPEARVRALGFRDLDRDPLDDWSAARLAGEIVFSGPVQPLEWNTVFNLWFESDAAPAPGAWSLDAARPGPGAATFAVTAAAPLELYNVHLGPGCARGTPPTLVATGTPPRATLGNATFALESQGNAPLSPNALYFSRASSPFSIQGCQVYLDAVAVSVSVVVSDALGVARHPAPIPNHIALEGLDAYLQAVGRDPLGGPLFRFYALSDGLLVRTGNSLTGCP